MNAEAIRPTTVLASGNHCRRRQGVRSRACSCSISILGIALLSAGCAAPQRTFEPAQDPATLDDVAFLHYLASIPVATVDEGMRAALLLKGVTVQPPSFEEHYRILRRIGAVRTTWRLSPDSILDKGTLAYMLATVCGLPRSLNELIAWTTGIGDRRYALKTCVHEGLMPYGLAYEPVKGGELLSALTEAERYLAAKSADQP